MCLANMIFSELKNTELQKDKFHQFICCMFLEYVDQEEEDSTVLRTYLNKLQYWVARSTGFR